MPEAYHALHCGTQPNESHLTDIPYRPVKFDGRTIWRSAGKAKNEGVADGINRLLQNLVLKCAKGDGIRDYFHVGVIGYGGRVVWALGGKLAGQKLVPISLIANNPLKVEQRSRKVDDGAGGLVEQKFKFPIWFEPVAVGRTPMCQAITEATAAVEDFIGRFPALQASRCP